MRVLVIASLIFILAGCTDTPTAPEVNRYSVPYPPSDVHQAHGFIIFKDNSNNEDGFRIYNWDKTLHVDVPENMNVVDDRIWRLPSGVGPRYVCAFNRGGESPLIGIY